MPLSRSDFLRGSAAALGSGAVGGRAAPAAASGRGLHVAPFRCDVTPPIGHSLCGGWIKPVIEVEDPLEAIGFVLLGAGAPIVVCVVDWTGILNEAHLAWRRALAEAAGTTAARWWPTPRACIFPNAATATEGILVGQRAGAR